jgi:hypothetical protein
MRYALNALEEEGDDLEDYGAFFSLVESREGILSNRVEIYIMWARTDYK